MSKKVLIISYHFPPLGGGGVQRTLKFTKYLPHYGWEPLILTVSNPEHPLWDHSLLKEISPGTKVIRVPALEISKWEKRFFALFKPSVKSSKGGKGGEPNHPEDPVFTNSKLKTLLKRIYIFLTFWLRIPDHKVGWVPFAFLEGLSMINSKKVDLIYVTSPPHSSQLVGFLLAKLTRKPWVADFRDDWLEDEQKISNLSSFRLKLEKFLAHRVFKNASFVIANTEYKKENYQKNYPEVKRIETIYNGFDAEDLNKAKLVEERWEDDKFHICHSGYFYPGTALPLFEILKDYFSENPDLRGKIQSDLVGHLEEEYKGWIYQNKLSEEIKGWGYVDHHSSINFLLKSHLLLHLIGSDGDSWKGVVAGKLFEYLASGKPIISFAPKGGESEKIIKQANSGWVFDLEDKQGIKDKLKELYNLFQRGELKVEQNVSFIQGFERKKLTQKLSTIFEKCVMHRQLSLC